MDAISILKANRMYEGYKDMEYLGDVTYRFNDHTSHRVAFRDFFNCLEYVDFSVDNDGNLLSAYPESSDPYKRRLCFIKHVVSIPDLRKMLAMVDAADAKEKTDAEATA